MKYLLFATIFLIVGCGTAPSNTGGGNGGDNAGACAGHKLVGTWRNPPTNNTRLSLNADCSGSYYDFNNGQTTPISYQRPAGDSGVFFMTYNNHQYACSFVVDDVHLQINCFGQNIVYDRES